MIFELLKAVAGIAIVMGAWFLVQSRKRSHPNQDTLEHLSHGCGGCRGDHSCGKTHSCSH